MGGQYGDYGLLLLLSPVIIQDARPNIVDNLLMLISRMGQSPCSYPFYLYRWPILPLWKEVTMQPFDCERGKTKNRGHSVDAHLQDIFPVIGSSTIVCKMHTVIIDSQYIISMCNHLHPKPLRSLSF